MLLHKIKEIKKGIKPFKIPFRSILFKEIPKNKTDNTTCGTTSASANVEFNDQFNLRVEDEKLEHNDPRKFEYESCSVPCVYYNFHHVFIYSLYLVHVFTSLQGHFHIQPFTCRRHGKMSNTRCCFVNNSVGCTGYSCALCYVERSHLLSTFLI